MRIAITEYLDYEDSGLLIFDAKSNSFVALSPNIELNEIKTPKKLSLFHYNPGKCISTTFLESKRKSLSINNPRDEPFFLEGVDNLTPASLCNLDSST